MKKAPEFSTHSNDLSPSQSERNIHMTKLGQEMHLLMERLFPICRSITGNGVRETLSLIQEHIPLVLHEIASGTSVFDWVIPDEWNINDAYVKDENGHRVIDFQKSNLHIVNYSIPFEGKLSLEELKEHLFTLPDQPDVIPYVTSYYSKRWGFCLSQNDYDSLKEGTYEVKVDSTLAPGSLSYADLLVEGQTNKEILLSTYTCHPSMANNELSGPIVTTFLAKWLLEKETKPYYSYRFVFIPENIGSIAYLHFNLNHLKEKVVGGYVLSCVGDPAHFTYLQTREENTLIDRVTLHVLKNSGKDYKLLDFPNSRSDERNYNSAGVDLHIGSLMRTKYGDYDEYHTSGDNMDIVTPKGLASSLLMYQKCIDVLEWNDSYVATVLGQPQLGKRNLYPTIGTLNSVSTFGAVLEMKNLLAYCDGKHDLVWIAEKLKCSIWDLLPIVATLQEHGLLHRIDNGKD